MAKVTELGSREGRIGARVLTLTQSFTGGEGSLGMEGGEMSPGKMRLGSQISKDKLGSERRGRAF